MKVHFHSILPLHYSYRLCQFPIFSRPDPFFFTPPFTPTNSSLTPYLSRPFEFSRKSITKNPIFYDMHVIEPYVDRMLDRKKKSADHTRRAAGGEWSEKDGIIFYKTQALSTNSYWFLHTTPCPSSSPLLSEMHAPIWTFKQLSRYPPLNSQFDCDWDNFLPRRFSISESRRRGKRFASEKGEDMLRIMLPIIACSCVHSSKGMSILHTKRALFDLLVKRTVDNVWKGGLLLLKV